MTDQQILLLALILIYLSECFVWVGHGAVAVRVLWRRYHAVDPPLFPGNERGGWAFLNPFPPFGTVFVCHQWPVVVTPEQVGPETGQSVNFRERPPTGALVMSWAAAGKLSGSGSRLMLAGEPMMRLPDESSADHFAVLLHRIARLPADQRQVAIDRAVSESFDVDAVVRRVDEFHRQTWLLRTLSLMFFSLLFLLLPTSIYLERFTATVYSILPLMLLTWIVAMWLFFRAHRRLLPGDRLARWKSLVTMMFAPTAVIRATDSISWNLLSGRDPVAVGAALMDDRTFAEFATRTLRDLRRPLPLSIHSTEITPTGSTEHESLAAEFRAKIAVQVMKLMEKRGVAVEASELDAPSEPTLRSYCPRCRLEYLVESGTCRDCGEMKLVAFGLTMSRQG